MLSRFGLIGLLLVGCVVAAALTGGMSATPTPTASAAPVAAEPAIAAVISKPTNPVVEPGKVHWYPTISAAFAAAMGSKKPVLVFHMMGRLDHQFC